MERGGDRTDGTTTKAPSQAVVEAVADAEGVSPDALRPPEYEPLHAVVDPEALDALFAPRPSGPARPSGIVSFSFCGYGVTVGRDGNVSLE